ncbi:hypothetical protein O181_006463 [Austropuccinia psidii MF-1]|uniref:Chromo domain-containing protein n=1 Tax=Austropuccinia psidii MF-1 TaxID=1389203 RepID=A0A9Q3GGL8_9BASI|nr:hypothetical protein [Austropuccinia psidii MF-1]
MVWLSSKNIKSTRPTKKASKKWLGPFPSLNKFSTHAYHLKLPSQWKSIHPVFHISLLEPVKTSSIPNWHQEPPPPIIIEEEEEWEVSQILHSKLKRRKLWYLVEMKGFSQDPERFTWEPAKNLKNIPELVKDFHYLYPDKPGHNSSRACFLWCLVGRGVIKTSPWELLENFANLDTDFWPGFQHQIPIYGHFQEGHWAIFSS